jgi:hypothetical protein
MPKTHNDKNQEHIYRINFIQKGATYEIYAKQIAHGGLFGFLEVEDIIFGENSSVVVDPSEERLRQEFKDVSCTFLPLHTIVRIDEVEKTGKAKITVNGKEGNVVQFPAPIYTPTNQATE